MVASMFVLLGLAPLFVKAGSEKEIVRSLFENALNEKKLDLLDELISPTYTGPQGRKGPDGFKAFIQPLIDAFPDIHWKITDIISEDGEVSVRWTWTGTQTGTWLDTPPTGKIISNDGDRRAHV